MCRRAVPVSYLLVLDKLEILDGRQRHAPLEVEHICADVAVPPRLPVGEGYKARATAAFEARIGGVMQGGAV